MLEKGVVSDEANKYFSPIELKTIHSSFCSLGRDFFGPGKRGTNKQGKARIKIMEKDGEYFLGYLFKGKPYLIPHINLGSTSAKLCGDKEKGEKCINDFVEKLDKYSSESISISLIDAKIPKEQMLIGFYQGKYFVASSKKLSEDAIKQNIVKFLDAYNNPAHDRTLKQGSMQNVKVHIKNIESPDTSRVFLKIAFNVIAHYRGEEYILNDNFDKARDWLMNPEQKNDASHDIGRIQSPLGQCDFMDKLKEHCCIITKQKDADGNKVIFAIVTLYGMTKCFTLGKAPNGDNCYTTPYGLFCNIETKKEQSLADKIVAFSLGNDAR